MIKMKNNTKKITRSTMGKRKHYNFVFRHFSKHTIYIKSHKNMNGLLKRYNYKIVGSSLGV